MSYPLRDPKAKTVWSKQTVERYKARLLRRRQRYVMTPEEFLNSSMKLKNEFFKAMKISAHTDWGFLHSSTFMPSLRLCLYSIKSHRLS